MCDPVCIQGTTEKRKFENAQLLNSTIFGGSECEGAPQPGQTTNPFERTVPQQSREITPVGNPTRRPAPGHTASQSGNVLVNLPTRMLNANRDAGFDRITRVPPAKARQDWFTVGLRTWASAANREFEVTLIKEVLGQCADLSRDGAVAHEMLFQH